MKLQVRMLVWIVAEVKFFNSWIIRPLAVKRCYMFLFTWCDSFGLDFCCHLEDAVYLYFLQGQGVPVEFIIMKSANSGQLETLQLSVVF